MRFGTGLLLVLVLVLVAACSSEDPVVSVGEVPSPTPSEAAACGHPGSTYVVTERTGTVKHADCDLTGVTIAFEGVAVVVPAPGHGAAASPGCVRGPCYGLQVMTAAETGDVTWQVSE